MGAVTELVRSFTPRLGPITDPHDGGIRAFQDVMAEFRESVRRLENVEAELADGLLSLLSDRDPWRAMLWITAAGVKPSVGLVEPLCRLLLVPDAYLQHEWIVEILGDIGSPGAITSLREVCSWPYEFDDAFHAMKKKCLQVLGSIGTPEALSAIEAQLSSPWGEVREEALRLTAGTRTLFLVEARPELRAQLQHWTDAGRVQLLLEPQLLVQRHGFREIASRDSFAVRMKLLYLASIRELTPLRDDAEAERVLGSVRIAVPVFERWWRMREVGNFESVEEMTESLEFVLGKVDNTGDRWVDEWLGAVRNMG